jgi:lactoylglutathione lyase
MNLAYNILYVEDVPATVSFYENAFGLQNKFIVEDKSYAEMLTGTTTLSFCSHELAQSNFELVFDKSSNAKKPFGCEIGFTTNNVQSAYDIAIHAGAIAVKPPTAKEWGQIVAYVRDNNGFLVELCTPMA